MRISRPLAITTLAATTLAGGLGGAVLLGPLDAEPSVSTEEAADHGRCRKGLADVAEAIGISTDDLRAALRDDQTLAAIAEANGVEAQQVVDVLVANGTERIDAAVEAGRIDQATADERRAKLPEHAAQLVNGELERDLRHGAHRHRAALRGIAETIGIDVEDLRAALEDGQTIAEVAEANGVDPQAVIDAQVARATERITKVVNGETPRRNC